MNEELEKIARDMRKKASELWAGNPPRMGRFAVALMLDGYASRLEVALGLAPMPNGKSAPAYYTPKAALDVIAGDRPLDAIFQNPPLDRKALFKVNERAAGMRPWLAYAVAAAVVVALLALPGIIMAVAGWLTGGVR